MRNTPFFHIGLVIALLTFHYATALAADPNCTGVCISYSAPSAVPLSPSTMALLSIVLGLTAYLAIRRKPTQLLAISLFAVAGVVGMATDIRSSIASAVYQVVLSAGNQAALALPPGFTGPVDVHNPQNVPVTITAISVGTGFALDPASPLHVGSVIPPGGTVSGAVVIASADATPPTLLSTSNLGSANIGQSVNDTLTFDEAIGSATVGTLPAGMTVTATASGSTVSLQISTNGSFTAFGSVTIPVTVGDSASPANTAVVNVTKVVNDVAPQGAVLADWWFSDNLGGSPMWPLDSGGDVLVPAPVPAEDITNPAYVASATCFVGGGTPVPNCYDPIHSYWGIDTTATDPAGRALTYSMVITPIISVFDHITSMRANLNIDANTGLITQACSSNCFQSDAGWSLDEVYSIAVTVQPSGGTLPLIRTFQVAIRDDG